MKRGIAAVVALGLASAGGAVLATQAGATGEESAAPEGIQVEAAKDRTAKAVMRDPEGRKVAVVTFTNRGSVTKVVGVFRKNSFVSAGFHGFHVHANNLAAGGQGCKADPDAEPATWFVSADGHLADADESHGKHTGDMPSVYTLANGKARVAFSIDKIGLKRLRGSAVMLHAGPDNFGNIPLGEGDDQYTANGDAATVKTTATGNSGDRVACGIIR